MDNNFSDILKIFTRLNESSPPTKFAGERRGQKPGAQWRGRDKGTPGNKLVGEGEGSVEQEIQAAWETYLAEVAVIGATNGAGAAPAPGTDTVDPAKMAQQKNAAVSGLQKLKAAGVNIPTSMNQAAQTALKTANDPAASQTQQDKNVGLGLGAEMEKLVATGNPGQVQQVANAIKQAKLSGAK